MDYYKLLLATLPDLIVVLGLFVALGLDYTKYKTLDRPARSQRAAVISSVALVLGLAALGWQQLRVFNECSIMAETYNGQIVLTSLTLGFKSIVFLLALFVVEFAKTQAPSKHVSEYFALILLSTLGMGFVITARNLVMFFVSIELISLSLYGLTAFQNRRKYSVEAGLKYFTIGSISSTFLLFGLSYLYGATHALNFDAITAAIQAGDAPSAYLLIAASFLLAGLGFKIAAAPFHLWAPDTYQCAPVPVAAWIATGSKIASFFVLVQLFVPILQNAPDKEILLKGLALISLVSMVLGNIGALRQTCLKRLLAYSSVAHAGYLLIGLLAANEEGSVSVLYYILVYAFATMGAFTVVGILSGRLGRDANIRDFNGCWKVHPGLSLLFMIFILSLAGIPPLSGFFGKLYLFMAAIGSHPEISSWYEGYYWLVAVALLLSAVSLFYYVKVLKAFLVYDESPAVGKVELDKGEFYGLIILAGLVIGLGLFPHVAVGLIASGLG